MNRAERIFSLFVPLPLPLSPLLSSGCVADSKQLAEEPLFLPPLSQPAVKEPSSSSSSSVTIDKRAVTTPVVVDDDDDDDSASDFESPQAQTAKQRKRRLQKTLTQKKGNGDANEKELLQLLQEGGGGEEQEESLQLVRRRGGLEKVASLVEVLLKHDFAAAFAMPLDPVSDEEWWRRSIKHHVLVIKYPPLPCLVPCIVTRYNSRFGSQSVSCHSVPHL
jgi:hypothetical protein